MNSVPIPKDTQDFQFKQSAVLPVCESIKNIPSACNLIVADAKRGLLYTATDDKLTIRKSDSNSNDWRLDHKLPYPVSRLSMSCDYSYLAVTFNRSTAHIYSASSLAKNSLELLHEIQLSHSSQNVFAYDLKWNPAIPGMFCTVASDHSIGSFQVKIEQKTTVGVIALEKIQNVEAMCVAWSPKGKQLVVGCKNGNIIQLKPELKVMRTISGPSPSIGEIITILWISNYQFCAAYYDGNERRVNVLIVDAPKGADAKPTFTCYEDITFGMPDNDAEYFPRYYFDYVPEWNLIIAASSSSSEVAILGSLNNGTTWEQWQLIDSGRAQLPFVRTSESYPVGMTIDRSSTVILPWGPESTLPHPVPVLHLFGTSGQIVSFHMVNLLPNCPALCTPPSEPVKTDQINTTITSEMTFVPHSVATSTPRPKQTESLIERPKVAIPPPNFFSEPAKSVAAPIAAPVNPQMSAPPVELKIPKPKPVDKPAATQQIESKLLSKQVPAPAPSPASAAPAPVSAPAPTPSAVEKITYDDSLCWRAFREEQIHFEKELQTILEPQVFDIGTKEEREKLILQSEQVDNFIQELNETTNSLSNEISYLNSLLLQSFGWLEETKSKQSSGNLIRDHHDKSKINELQRRFSHLQSQLIQAMKVLDSRWAENEQQEMAKFKIPGLEYIYQCLTRYNQLIQINKKRIDEQTKKWKSLSRGNKISSLNKSLSKLNISSTSYGGNTEDDMIEMRCKAVADNTKNFTLQKQNKLRDILMQTEPRVIKNINPSNVHGRLEATLSALALQSTTPITTKKKDKATPAVATSSAVTPSAITSAVVTPSAVNPGVVTPPFVTTAAGTTALTKIIFTSTGASTETKSLKPATKPQSPLASLNSIVANLGSSSLDTSVNQTKTSQPLNFPASTFSSVFGSNLTIPRVNDKLNLAGGQTFVVKKVTTQQNTTPVQSAPVAATTGFSKPIPISFGTPEPKADNSTPKENTSKPVITFKAKETPTTPGQPLSLFTSNILETSVAGLGTPKVNQPATAGQNQPTNLGTSMTLSLKSSLPSPVTTSQQSLFSFATQPLTTSTSKPVTAAALSESIQTFSFASKPMDAPTLPSMSEQFSTPPTTQSLDLSKLSSGLSLPNVVAEKPASSVPSSTFSFGQLSIPSTPLNFGKASAATPTSAALQSAGINVSLPAGTTIKKQPLSSTSPPSTQTSSLFNTSPLLSSSMFGGTTAGQTSTSIFGGNAAAVTTSQSVLQDNNKVTSTTAEKTSTAQLSQLSFGESQSTSTNFSNAVSKLFGKPLAQATTSTTSPSFSQPAAATSPSFAQSAAATGTASPFAQPTAATGTTLPSFAQSAAATGAASPFAQSPAAATGATSPSFAQSAAATGATSPSFAQSAAATGATSPSFAQSAAATGAAPPSFAQSAAATGAAPPSFAQSVAASGTTSPLFGQSGATTGITSPIFGQSGLSTPANPVKIPPTTTASSFFGAPQNQSISSPFSGSGTSSLSSMFGATTVNSEPAPPGTGIGSGSSMFGGGTSNTSTPLFGAASPTSPSIFGGAAAKPAAPAFGGAPTFGSPTAPAFGGTATFGSKPVFGAQSSVFGASSPFGAAPAFGASPFGSSMPVNPQDGNMSMGNTTFETLATQNGGLSFNSLAQKSPTQDKPAFSGGSSFTSWR
ncbi:nuclear pore complex protein Nup214 [Microplitis demolitor]|uniref:nuclear pore complex protein Nup214 n=1 Tax=Microplitis demolitor TaxID=69319 RepID=UPI0004CCAF05|nr:nuclear pore complex protein Nup214 [Microplitis demolitor]